MEELSSDKIFSVEPNPPNGVFIVTRKTTQSCETGSEVSIEVRNTFGQIIFSSENLNPNFSREIDLSKISIGIYFLEIISQGKFYREKIVNER